jgi:hypothetical protein
MSCEPLTRLEKTLLITLYFVVLAGIIFVVVADMLVSEYKKYIRNHCRYEDSNRRKEVYYTDVGTQTSRDLGEESEVCRGGL